VLSWNQVAAVAIRAGWPPGDAVIAVSITQPESSRDSSAVQQGQPYATTGWGLWQITPGNSVPQFGINQAMLDPLNNARAGHYKWAAAGSFIPWTTWAHRLNVPYIGAATAAVQYVTGLSKKKLDQLVATARAGQGEGGGSGEGELNWSPYVRSSAGHVARSALTLASSAAAITALHESFAPPAVVVPDPSTLLWTPGGPDDNTAPGQLARTGPPDSPPDTDRTGRPGPDGDLDDPLRD
jgi:hypothetical protein